MNRIKFILVSLVLALFVFSACSDDDESSRTNYTPEQNKEEIKTIINGMLGQVKPEDHKDLLQVLIYFGQINNDLQLLPGGSPRAKAAMNNLLNATKALCEKNDVKEMTRAMSGALSLSMLNGTHTYVDETETWNRTSNTTGLEINFMFKGQPAVFKLTPSEKTHVSSLNFTNDGETMSLDLDIPEKIYGEITLGGTKLLQLDGEFKLNGDLSAGEIKLKVNANDYVFKAELKANPNHADFDASVKIHGKEWIDIDLEANGNHMTEAQAIVDALASEDSEKALLNLFHNAKAEVVLGDAIVLKGQCSDIQKLFEPAFRPLYVDGKFDFEKQKQAIDDFIDAFHQTTKVELYYTDGKNVIATLDLKAMTDPDSDPDSDRTYIDVNVNFVVDGSSVSVEEFFGNEDFYGDIVVSFQKLLEQYQGFILELQGEIVE